MEVIIKNEKIRQYEYNNLLTEANHLKVAKAQYVLKLYDLWLTEEITFDFFKKELNK